MRHFVPEKTLTNIYNAHIQPHLDYGSLVWGECANAHIQKIAIQQKKSIRIMNFKKFRHPTAELFKTKQILPINENIRYLEIKFIWKILNRTTLIPNGIMNIFTSHGSVHKLSNALKLHLPFKRTDHGQNYITYSGIKQWNSIPKNIRCITSTQLFKKSLKMHLLSNIA